MRHVPASLCTPRSRETDFLSPLREKERNQFAGAAERYDAPRRGHGVRMAGREKGWDISPSISIDTLFSRVRIRFASQKIMCGVDDEILKPIHDLKSYFKDLEIHAECMQTFKIASSDFKDLHARRPKIFLNSIAR